MQQWKEELLSTRPEKLTVLNQDMVIERRNIEKYEKDAADGSGNKETGYRCECRMLTKDEYYQLTMEEKTGDDIMTCMEAQADIYEKLASTEDNQLTIMQAIADIYDGKEGA